MNVFEAVKEAVTTRQAAEAYGIPVRRNGMCLCPFHNDKNPSMKVDRRFHCFGCQADGDVIDFTAKLYGLTGKEAAVKLAADFGIRYDVGGHDPPVKKPVMPKISEELRQRQSEQKYFRPQRHGTVRADEHQPRQGLIRFTVKRIKRGVNGKEVPEGKSPVCLYPGENKTA